MYIPCAFLPNRNTSTFAKEAYIKVFNVALLVKETETTFPLGKMAK